MRSIGVRLPILAATVWAGIGLSAWAMDLRYAETVYLTPTAETVVWPTTYVSSRSYVLPTAYVAPSYFPTSYVEEPLVLTSTYRLRRGLFGRLRLVERPAIASYGTIVPTAFYLPSYYTTSYRARVYSPTVYYSHRLHSHGLRVSDRVGNRLFEPRATECCDQVAWAAPATTAPTQSYTAPPQDYYGSALERGLKVGPERADRRPDNPFQCRPGPGRRRENPAELAAGGDQDTDPAGSR